MIALIAGCGLVSFFPVLPSPVWAAALVLLLVIALVFRRWIACAVIIGVLIGWGAGAGGLQRQIPHALEGLDLSAVGRVCSIPRVLDHLVSFDFCADSLRDPASGSQLFDSIKLRLNWYRDFPDLSPDETLHLVVRLKRPHGQLNPEGFDRETWLFRNGYGATGYVRHPVEETATPRFSFPAWMTAQRYRFLQAIQGSAERYGHSASIAALTLGVKDSLASDQWDLLARTGTTHLLVISGMHIGLFATMSYLLVRFVWLRLPWAASRARAELPAGILALLSAGIYTLLSGAGIPARRAFLMVFVATVAVMLMRHWRASTVFLVAMAGVLITEPLAWRSAGFWLSFGAVAVIGAGMSGRVVQIRQRWRQLWRVQWTITLLLMPLLLFWFSQVSWVSGFVNLLAVPLITLWVAPTALLGVLFTGFDMGQAHLFRIASLGLDLFWFLVAYAGAQSWAAERLWVPEWVILPLLVVLAVALLPFRSPGQYLLLVPVLVWLYPPGHHSPSEELRFMLLDVGQGQASYFVVGEHTGLYDAGPAYSGSYDAGAAIVVPVLQAMGVTRLEQMVVSHGDSDHAGGVRSVLDAFDIGRMLTGEPDTFASKQGEVQCLAGQEWTWRRTEFSILWPVTPLKSDSNNRSCVMKVTHGDWSILLTGDIDQATERQLIQMYGVGLAANVLVLAHHGSKHSSSVEFLKVVKPELALVSAGYRNRFRHPADEVRARLESLGIPLMNTAEHGAIALRVFQDRVVVQGERARRLGYWYTRSGSSGEFTITLKASET